MKYLFILIFLGLASCNTAQNNPNTNYRIENAFSNYKFNNPVDLQNADDGSNRIFVVTQEGIIYSFNKLEENTELNTFLDIKNKVKSGGEMGLLGLAFHPDFENNKLFYINYTAPDPLRTIIAEYTVSSTNENAADAASERILFEVEQPYQNHNAGQLAFGPDGFLYIGFGDGGSGGDPQNNAQNPKVFLGKMLRIDVNSSSNNKPYGIPQDNPFINDQNFLPEIWALGLRNPWRYSFDVVTGNLWVADVGQNMYEEINVLEKGKNYGWRITEGFHCYNPSSGCDTSGLTYPVWEYKHDDNGGYSITGGYVYRGENIPSLNGKYIYGDYVSGRIWALNYDENSEAENELLISDASQISSFGVDEDNEIYILSFDGNIYTITSDETTSIIDENNTQGFKLENNFPNPFNPTTLISYSVNELSEVQLKVYDIYGKEIKTLIDKTQNAGYYKIKFDGRDLSSGIYFYQLKNNKFQISKKMILLK